MQRKEVLEVSEQEAKFISDLKEDGVKTALKRLMKIPLYAAEIRQRYPDDDFKSLIAIIGSGNKAEQKINSVKADDLLNDEPITYMAMGFILLDSDCDLYKEIGRFLLVQGFDKELSNRDKKKGRRPLSTDKKLFEIYHLVSISQLFDSMDVTLQELYQEVADLECKSTDTIRRRYERFSKNHSQHDDKVLVFVRLYRDYIAELSEKHFFYRIVGNEKKLNQLEMKTGINDSSIYKLLYDTDILTEAVLEYHLESLIDLTGMSYGDARKLFVKLSKNLHFNEVHILKKILKYAD